MFRSFLVLIRENNVSHDPIEGQQQDGLQDLAFIKGKGKASSRAMKRTELGVIGSEVIV